MHSNVVFVGFIWFAVSFLYHKYLSFWVYTWLPNFDIQYCSDSFQAYSEILKENLFFWGVGG
jgi:hypothetical protein